MAGILLWLAGPILGFAVKGLLGLFFPAQEQMVIQQVGGVSFTYVLWGLAIVSLFAHIGLTRKLTPADKPTLIGKVLGLAHAALVAVSTGFWEVVLKGKQNAQKEISEEVAQ